MNIIETKRTIRKEIQFSEEEYSRIQMKSNMAGITPAVFIRNAASGKEIKAAMTPQEIELIQRCQKVSVGLQTNLNQIAQKVNIHGCLPLYNSIMQLIKNIDQYFHTGIWNNIDIPQNAKQLQEILDEANSKYQDLRNKAFYLFSFTLEGEKFFKEKYKCSIYTNSEKTKYFFRVKDSNRLAVEIPQQMIFKYHNREISIKDIYDYFINLK